MGFFTDVDNYLFRQGTSYEVYKKMGAHIVTENDVKGTRFVLWAPNAQAVSVVCETIEPDREIPMERSADGIWEVFIPQIKSGDVYRYAITGADGVKRYKSDPYSFRYQLRPDNGSVVCSLRGYKWNDSDYMADVDNTAVIDRPMAIYEVHLGSWKKKYRYYK